MLLMIGSSIVLALSLGIRHAFGLFLPPMSLEFGWGREVFAFAIAIQNLIWGLLQPFVGAFADRYGVKRTVFISAIAYALGLLLMAFASTPSALVLSAGLLIGFGLSGTSFAVLLSAVGRSVVAEKRSMAMGIASAAGSLGQFVMLPGTLGLLEWLGWSSALLVCAALIALLLPLSRMLREDLDVSESSEAKLPLLSVLRQVAGHTDFSATVAGFSCLRLSSGVYWHSYSSLLTRSTLTRSRRHHGAGSSWLVQYCWHLVCGLARRPLCEATAACSAILTTRGSDCLVFLYADQFVFGLRLRYCDGLAVAIPLCPLPMAPSLVCLAYVIYQCWLGWYFYSTKSAHSWGGWLGGLAYSFKPVAMP